MTPLSNLHGRVLEYLIVEAIIRAYPRPVLTNGAKSGQQRDCGKLKDVNPNLLQQLNRATNAFLVQWLEPQFLISRQASLIIDRLPDQNQTDVTDIRIGLPGETINLSIKHNNVALRHQRPGTTPIHCGYAKSSTEMEQFKQQYKAIAENFTLQTGQAQLFAELPHILIEELLYAPVCHLVAEFINIHSPDCAPALFQYLVGSKDYYKIIIDTNARKLTIQHFNYLAAPSSVNALVRKQYVDLTFDNGWEITMRLHTASSRLTGSPSLKFDTKALNNYLASTIVSY
ncbi:MAG: hypothetical protein N5P05_004313 (plasmid) [Chroococcopsis gigantea SAG 12.99]|jgi:hypothetical protein|nr:hypothetical protein [Chroococcopsis gigantea SAG 12.99]